MVGFLDLPLELRNRIYEYDVPHNQVIPLSQVVDRVQSTNNDLFLEDHEPVFPQLPVYAGVSRQVRAEALSIYYGSNIFTANSMLDTSNFLQRLDSQSLTRIREIRATTCQHSAIKQLVKPKLEKLVTHSAMGLLSRNAAKVPLRTKRTGRGSSDGDFEMTWVSLAELHLWERDPRDIDMVRRVTWLSRY